MRLIILILILIAKFSNLNAQEIALLKYDGGGDWYSNPTSLPNLIKFVNNTIESKIASNASEVKPEDPEIFNYQFIHLTGHGNIYFSDEASKNLKRLSALWRFFTC